MKRLLTLLLLCLPAVALSGCVVLAIGNRAPEVKKTITQTDSKSGCGCAKSLMLASPDGKCWVLTVDNSGAVGAKPAPCKGTDACKCGAKADACKCGKGAGCQCGKAKAADVGAQKPGCGGCKGMAGAQGGSQMTEPIPTVNIGGEAKR